MKKKACKNCKMIYEGSECPNCKRQDGSANWQGRVFIIDSDKSLIANKVGIKKEGEYAIKVK